MIKGEYFVIRTIGCVAIGMWGVPSFSHKNNGVLAFKCGALIRSRVESLEHRCSIGLASGLIYCSSIGSMIRRDYVGIGDKVNLAARLMAKAKGRILFDESTFKMIPSDVREKLLKLTEEMHLKGTNATRFIMRNQLNLTRRGSSPAV